MDNSWGHQMMSGNTKAVAGHRKVNDVARSAELAVRAGSCQSRKEIFIHIALEILAVMRRQVEFLNALNDGAERRSVVNFEGGAAEQKFASVGNPQGTEPTAFPTTGSIVESLHYRLRRITWKRQPKNQRRR